MQLIKSSIWSFPPIYLLSIHLLRDFQACLPRSCSEVIFFNVCMSAFLHSWFFLNLPEVPFLIFWKRSSTIQQVSFLFEKKCLKIEACLAVFFFSQADLAQWICLLPERFLVYSISLAILPHGKEHQHTSLITQRAQSIANRSWLHYWLCFYISHIRWGGCF